MAFAPVPQMSETDSPPMLYQAILLAMGCSWQTDTFLTSYLLIFHLFSQLQNIPQNAERIRLLPHNFYLKPLP